MLEVSLSININIKSIIIIINESITLTLTGRNSIFEAQYYPSIKLNPLKKYAIGLVELYTLNSISNVDDKNNKFYIENSAPIIIPEGSYEIDNIHKYLSEQL